MVRSFGFFIAIDSTAPWKTKKFFAFTLIPNTSNWVKYSWTETYYKFIIFSKHGFVLTISCNNFRNFVNILMNLKKKIDQYICTHFSVYFVVRCRSLNQPCKLTFSIIIQFEDCSDRSTKNILKSDYSRNMQI